MGLRSGTTSFKSSELFPQLPDRAPPPLVLAEIWRPCTGLRESFEIRPVYTTRPPLALPMRARAREFQPELHKTRSRSGRAADAGGASGRAPEGSFATLLHALRFSSSTSARSLPYSRGNYLRAGVGGQKKAVILRLQKSPFSASLRPSTRASVCRGSIPARCNYIGRSRAAKFRAGRCLRLRASPCETQNAPCGFWLV